MDPSEVVIIDPDGTHLRCERCARAGPMGTRGGISQRPSPTGGSSVETPPGGAPRRDLRPDPIRRVCGGNGGLDRALFHQRPLVDRDDNSLGSRSRACAVSDVGRHFWATGPALRRGSPPCSRSPAPSTQHGCSRNHSGHPAHAECRMGSNCPHPLAIHRLDRGSRRPNPAARAPHSPGTSRAR